VDLSVVEFREHVTSALGDEALQALLNAAYAAIVRRVGPEASAVERLAGASGPLLLLNRAASSITSVTEDGTLLDALDYLLRPSGMTIERLRTGPNPRLYWRGWVDVVSTPLVDTAERIRVTIALVKLDLAQNPGITAIRIGDWAETYADSAMNYGLEREAILATLALDQVGIY
jgi:hypothetical protein